MRGAVLFPTAVLALSLACGRPAASPPVHHAKPANLPVVVLPSGREITVELARDPEERARGLMFRESLPTDHGLLFLFDEPGRPTFWMKNCNFPIDIVWIDADLRFVDAVYAAAPCRASPCPTWGPSGEAVYVLEVAAGVAAAEELGPRSTFRFRNVPTLPAR